MRFKSYDEFLNESFLSNVKKLIKKVGDYFTGQGSRFLNLLVAQKEKHLPKGVTVYPTSEDIAILKDYGVTVTVPKIPSLKESENLWDGKPLVNEAIISTKYPDMGKVKDVDSKGLDNFIRDTVEGGKNVKPLLIWGPPGIGKTAIINAIAKEYFGPEAKEERRLIDFDLMTMSPEDFFIPTVTNKDTAQAKGARLPDEWLPVRRIDDKEAEKEINGPDGKGGILFFDEIARCSTKVQNVCLKIVDERKIGNYVLGENWVIICAANRKSDLSDDEQEAFHWSSTLANRFQQINYASTIADWKPWAMSATDDLGQLLVKPEIVAFLDFNQKYFHLLDPEDFSNTSGGSQAWPSPRTWTNASQALTNRERRYERNDWKDAKGKKISHDQWMEEQEDILAANVGSEAARAFLGFKKLLDKFDPRDIEKVYTDPDKAPKWKGLAIDEINALISAACFQMRDKKELNKTQMDNFATWIINSKDAANAIKAINMLKEVVPSVEDSDYWKDEVKGRYVDEFPNIFSKKK